MAAISRRQFVRLLAVGGGAILTGCAPSPTPTQPAPAAPAPAAPAPAAPAPAAPAAAAPAAKPAESPKPSAPKVLTIAQGTEPKTIDPNNETMDSARNILLNLFDPLVAGDNDMKLVPMLAESWKATDEKTWEFKLRKGVKFHNGQDFTADDVKFTIERIINKDNNLNMRPFLEQFQAVQVVDPSTVHIITKVPYPLTAAQLRWVFIVPAKTFQEMGKDAFSKKPVGTGPFKLVEWVQDDHLTMEKNPSYWRAPVKLDRVIWKPIPEAAARVAALVTGAVQIIYPSDPQDVAVIEKNSDLVTAKVRILRQSYVGMNIFEKPLSDVRVRRAVAYAIDVDNIIKTVLDGHAYRVPGALGGPAIFGYDPNFKPYPFDPEQSKKLLADAGYPNGFEIDFISPQGRWPKDAEQSQAMAGYLQKVGIKANLRVLEWGTYQQTFLNKQAKGLHCWSNGNSLLDPDYHVGLNFYSKGRGLYYNTPKTDDLILQGASTVDQDKRIQIYRELQKVMQDDVAIVPIADYEGIYGVSKKVVDFKPRADEMIYAYNLDVK